MSLPRRFFFKVSLNICLQLILVFMLLDAEMIKTSNTANLTLCIHFCVQSFREAENIFSVLSKKCVVSKNVPRNSSPTNIGVF